MKAIKLKSLKKSVLKLLTITFTVSSIPFGVVANAQHNGLDESETRTLEHMSLLGQMTNELKPQESSSVQREFINDLENGNFDIQVSYEKLDLENISILSITSELDDLISVTVPISGDDYNILSNITFIYDSNLNIVSYQESLVTRSIDDTFKFIFYIDGQKVRAEVSDIEYVSNEEFEEGLRELEIIESSKARSTGACLAAVLGVSGIVGNTIAKMCVGSCVLVVTAKVCVACVGAFAVVGGASITAVASCFN